MASRSELIASHAVRYAALMASEGRSDRYMRDHLNSRFPGSNPSTVGSLITAGRNANVAGEGISASDIDAPLGVARVRGGGAGSVGYYYTARVVILDRQTGEFVVRTVEERNSAALSESEIAAMALADLDARSSTFDGYPGKLGDAQRFQVQQTQILSAYQVTA
jgi:hypothetical protein